MRDRTALPPRLMEVTQLVAAGHSDKEIGIRLSLAPSTVSTYLRSILWRLRRTRRSQLAQWVAARAGGLATA
jgi:DNA-binding NarL/FixJ family response regulator